MVALEQPDPARRRELSEVLREEFEAIGGAERFGRALVDAVAAAQELRPDGPPPTAEEAQRKLLYDAAHRLDLTALCLSGGGIRSAAISLGVIQALVDHKLLDKFNYLSTVSGGGYIGSWLSAWLHHASNSTAVLDRLGSRRDNSDAEPGPLKHLREYSNYLTPKLGLFSADTWAALAIVLRNILVNWLILVPALALLVIGVKILALALTIPAGAPPPNWTLAELVVAGLCLLSGGLALGYKLGRLYLPAYSEREAADRDPLAEDETVSVAQNRFIGRSLAPAVIGGLCFAWLAFNKTIPAVILTALFPGVLEPGTPWSMIFFAGIVYLLALLVGNGYARKFAPPGTGHARPFGLGAADFASWIGAVLVFAVAVWAGASFFKNLGDNITWSDAWCTTSVNACVADPKPHQVPLIVRREALVVIFGMPWFLLATMLAHSIYLLLNSASRKGEVEREWLGRASGWHFIAGLAWIMLSAVVLFGPALYYEWQNTVHILTVVSGAVTALLGKSGFTSATGKPSDTKGLMANIAMAIAGPIFAVLFLTLLSVVIDWIVFGELKPCLPTNEEWRPCRDDSWLFSWRWLIPLIGSTVILFVADRLANINAFSLHAVYRNRLIRAFLGAARDPHRHPDGFTDFDWDDDLRVASLWRRTDPPTLPVGANWRPFHVINTTLNLAETNRLSWQQRKAMPFSVTPFTCGNADLGYRPTNRYAGPPERTPDGIEHLRGISVGTAMAISGAAVSSNMGYHSSMSLSFLLTFFNVRLGVWLGNTRGKWGDGPDAPYAQPGPRFAVASLLCELFGLTTDERRYVYLSDGGHFEDLGLYEMVRRRCKWIVVVDGDQDGKRGFADLGNAVRKIWIDLGVRISFHASDLLAAEAEAKLAGIPYFAVGKITYVSDPRDADGSIREGKILYIKPVVRGDESAADVIAYKRAHPAFPAQSTANQWFDESQFESYRRLGHLMTERIIAATGVEEEAWPTLDALFDRLDDIDQAKMAAATDEA